MTAAASAQKKFIQVDFACRGPDTGKHFRLLQEQQEEINEQLGFDVLWRELPNKKVSQVRVRLEEVDPTDKSDWKRQHSWILDKLESFNQVFRQRIKSL